MLYAAIAMLKPEKGSTQEFIRFGTGNRINEKRLHAIGRDAVFYGVILQSAEMSFLIVSLPAYFEAAASENP